MIFCQAFEQTAHAQHSRPTQPGLASGHWQGDICAVWPFGWRLSGLDVCLLALWTIVGFDLCLLALWLVTVRAWCVPAGPLATVGLIDLCLLAL